MLFIFFGSSSYRKIQSIPVKVICSRIMIHLPKAEWTLQKHKTQAKHKQNNNKNVKKAGNQIWQSITVKLISL